MAKKFLTGLKLLNLSQDPLSGSDGEIYYNSESSDIKYYGGSSWNSLLTGEGSFSIQSGDNFPESPEEGSFFFKIKNLSLYLYLGGAWLEVGSTPPFNGGFAITTEFKGGLDGGEPNSIFSGGISGGSVVQEFLLA